MDYRWTFNYWGNGECVAEVIAPTRKEAVEELIKIVGEKKAMDLVNNTKMKFYPANLKKVCGYCGNIIVNNKCENCGAN